MSMSECQMTTRRLLFSSVIWLFSNFGYNVRQMARQLPAKKFSSAAWIDITNFSVSFFA